MEEKKEITRRDAIKRMGKFAAAAMAASVIQPIQVAAKEMEGGTSPAYTDFYKSYTKYTKYNKYNSYYSYYSYYSYNSYGVYNKYGSYTEYNSYYSYYTSYYSYTSYGVYTSYYVYYGNVFIPYYNYIVYYW